MKIQDGLDYLSSLRTHPGHLPFVKLFYDGSGGIYDSSEVNRILRLDIGDFERIVWEFKEKPLREKILIKKAELAALETQLSQLKK